MDSVVQRWQIPAGVTNFQKSVGTSLSTEFLALNTIDGLYWSMYLQEVCRTSRRGRTGYLPTRSPYGLSGSQRSRHYWLVTMSGSRPQEQSMNRHYTTC